MAVVTSLIAVAVLLGVLILVRRNIRKESTRPKPDQHNKNTTERNTRFHAVSIRFAPCACEAAKHIEGQRFLSAAAPRFPLPECDAAQCKCRFKHHTDRRTGNDRRDAWGQSFSYPSTGQYPKEQRKGSDRRGRRPGE
mgnify:CR=1 FL=1